MKIGANVSTTMQSNATGKKSTPTRNTPFNGAIQCASFYYLDKFALLVKILHLLLFKRKKKKKYCQFLTNIYLFLFFIDY